MSRLHWPASGALWDLQLFKHSQPKCSFQLNTSHLSSWFFKPREVTPVSQASDLFTWSRHGLAPTKLVPGSEHSFLSESPRWSEPLVCQRESFWWLVTHHISVYGSGGHATEHNSPHFASHSFLHFIRAEQVHGCEVTHPGFFPRSEKGPSHSLGPFLEWHCLPIWLTAYSWPYGAPVRSTLCFVCLSVF